MSKGLTNKYLEELGVKLLPNSFLGVYPCDLQPVVKKSTFSVIFNTDKSKGLGKHFVAIFANGNEIIYFDPFGEKVTNKDILKFLDDNVKNRKFYCNCTQVQADESNFCGYFCLSFLLSMYKHKSYSKFMKIFDLNHLLKNNKIVTNYLLKHIDE